MTIAKNAKTNIVNVFKAYQDEDGLEFSKTDITVELSRLGSEKLISRSQAKRVLKGLDTRFTNITLDFSKVKLVGQAFVDEIFRVYKNKHPNIKFYYININDDVKFMIERSL